MFVNTNTDEDYNNEETEPAIDDDDDFEDDKDSQMDATPDQMSLDTVVQTCGRLQSQLSCLKSLKHSGLSCLELCRIVLRILKLLTATYTIKINTQKERKVTLQYKNVGYSRTTDEDQGDFQNKPDPAALEETLQTKFAMSVPAREVLLSLLVNILSNKGPLRSVSNAAIYA
jgi:hypothetical protein